MLAAPWRYVCTNLTCALLFSFLLFCLGWTLGLAAYIFLYIMATLNTSLEEVNRTDALKIASCIIFGVTVVFIIARQIMKAVVFHRAGLDDLFILLASVSN
jgi:tellurite resistance protein TehA-like permease